MVPVTLIPAVFPKETGGSPEFPDYPSKRMPRSQTSVGSRPLAVTRTGLPPSRRWTLSAFVPVARTYSLTTTIHFSGFNSAACALAFPLLRTPSADDRTSVPLSTRWLAFGRVGLDRTRGRTHWVILTNFKGCHPSSNVPSLSRHDHRTCWACSSSQLFCPFRRTNTAPVETSELPTSTTQGISHRSRELMNREMGPLNR